MKKGNNFEEQRHDNFLAKKLPQPYSSPIWVEIRHRYWQGSHSFPLWVNGEWNVLQYLHPIGMNKPHLQNWRLHLHSNLLECLGKCSTLQCVDSQKKCVVIYERAFFRSRSSWMWKNSSKEKWKEGTDARATIRYLRYIIRYSRRHAL